MGSVSIPLNSRKYPGLFAIADEEDYERVSPHRWRVSCERGRYYARSTINGKTTSLHRFVLDAPAGTLVDHKDFDGLNCTKENLRFATPVQNVGHMRKHGRNTSGYKGIAWVPALGRWVATIKNARRKYNLGTFQTKVEAARHYDAAAHVLLGEFAEPNSPERHPDLEEKVRRLIEGTRTGTRRKQRSGVVGVYAHPNGRYYAYFDAGKHRHNLGGFPSVESAQEARNHAMKEASP